MIIPEHITLELILSRCKECACCGARTHFVGGDECRAATIDFMVGGVRKKVFVRRVVWQLAHPEMHLPTGKTVVISSTCTNRRCVNPEMVLRMTKSKAWSEHAKRGVRVGPAALRKAVATRRSRSKLPDHGAEDIRTSEEHPKALAAKWGVSEAYVYMIKAGLYRQPLSNPFAGLMA